MLVSVTFLSLVFQSSTLLTAHFTQSSVPQVHPACKIISTFLETDCKEMNDKVKLEDWAGKQGGDDRRRKWVS